MWKCLEPTWNRFVLRVCARFLDWADGYSARMIKRRKVSLEHAAELHARCEGYPGTWRYRISKTNYETKIHLYNRSVSRRNELLEHKQEFFRLLSKVS